MALWRCGYGPARVPCSWRAAIRWRGPAAITEGPLERPLIAFCNDPARAAGIAPMKLAAAQALARTLAVVPRIPVMNATHCNELACWAYQFRPR